MRRERERERLHGRTNLGRLWFWLAPCAADQLVGSKNLSGLSPWFFLPIISSLSPSLSLSKFCFHTTWSRAYAPHPSFWGYKSHWLLLLRTPSHTLGSQPKKMLTQPAFKFLFWILTFSSLAQHGKGAKCGSANSPTIKQTQVGSGNSPKFMVQVQNNCPMCPVIDIHLKCSNFSQALVNPRLFKVVASNDCVINGGLPLAPSQSFSFNYSHPKYLLYPKTWFFQCE